MTNRQPIAIRIACIEPLESRRLLSAVAESTLPLVHCHIYKLG